MPIIIRSSIFGTTDRYRHAGHLTNNPYHIVHNGHLLCFGIALLTQQLGPTSTPHWAVAARP
ncbi:MAG: hypothetical protein IJU72_05510 [Bacteroidales bacterium]|nr:hypothetical protein [Bacteroidales bacterium]